MRLIGILNFVLLMVIGEAHIYGQSFSVKSPDKKLSVSIGNNEKLTYSVSLEGRIIVDTSKLGFELKDEVKMDGDFLVLKQDTNAIRETWIPVIKSKHAKISDYYNELTLELKERSGPQRRMDLFVRAYNDGIAFRYKLYRGEKITSRGITRELTAFHIPSDPKAWIVEYKGGYSSSQEAEYMEHNVSYLTEKSIAGLPLLMDYGNNCWVAITEANIDNFSGFYIGTDGSANHLTTKLVPIPGEPENGVKVRFFDDIYTPWRVIMVGQTPGTLIESEIIQNLNEPCALKDPSWIKPGKSSWDNWWSGDVKMEMPVIKRYIDLASEMNWEYMLVDWKWYGKFKCPEADITRSDPQIDMPEIIRYAKSKKVRILVWLYSSDVNRNSAYKEVFPLYKKWGIAGVKIDFMDRDDQEMVNWYHDIIKCAAENQLLVVFHGAYKPDGIIRTYPNMITREGVMGNEYYNFSNKMSPEHNVKLAFTRMLAGQMDYTPGGFLNVTKEEFKNQRPTVVANTRAAELSKFVIYESPLTIVCDHPDHIINQPGADFLKIVPTTWDNIKYLGGYPGEYIALAKQKGDTWYLGAMNNSIRKEVEIKLDFLAAGNYEMEIWADSPESDIKPKELQRRKEIVKNGQTLKINLAKNGGFVSVIRENKSKKN